MITISELECSYNESEVKRIIADYYKKQFGRKVSVLVNKRKTRKRITDKFQPLIDYSIVDTINLGDVETYTINNLSQDDINKILKDRVRNEGYCTKDIEVDASIDRVSRKRSNVIFQKIKVLFEKSQCESDTSNELTEDDKLKLNQESTVLNLNELFKLIKEYYREYEHKDVDVEFKPCVISTDNDILANCYFQVTEKVVVFNKIKEISSYIDLEKLQFILSVILYSKGYKLNSINLFKPEAYLSNILSIETLTKLYINVIKSEQLLKDDNLDNSDSISQTNQKVSYKKKIINFFSKRRYNK